MSEPVSTTVAAEPAPETPASQPNEYIEAFKAVQDSNVVAPEPETPETPSEEPKTEEPKAPKLGSRFAALTKKENEVRRKETELKEQLVRVQKFEELTNGSNLDPLQALEVLGLSAEQVIQAVLSKDATVEEPDELTKLRMTVDELLESKEADKKAQEERETQQAKQALDSALDSYRGEVSQFIEANADKYETVRALEQESAAMDIMQRFFEETGEVPEPETVLDYLEEYLTEGAKRVIGLKKFTSADNTAVRDTPPDEQDRNRPSPTISNRHTASNSSAPDERPLTEEERLQRATSLLNFVR